MFSTTPFTVWGRYKSYQEEPDQLKALARFYFLMDAIDFAEKTSAQAGCQLVVTSDLTSSRTTSIYDRGKLRYDLKVVA